MKGLLNFKQFQKQLV